MFTLVLLLNIYFSLHIVQKKENKYATVQTQKIKRPSLLGTIISSSIKSSNRRSNAMQQGIQDAIMGSFSSKSEDAWQKSRKQADANARARWDAIDRQKKAEWDARDAALRGKDKAAYQYKNQADYWRKQSKR